MAELHKQRYKKTVRGKLLKSEVKVIIGITTNDSAFLYSRTTFSFYTAHWKQFEKSRNASAKWNCSHKTLSLCFLGIAHSCVLSLCHLDKVPWYGDIIGITYDGMGDISESGPTKQMP